MSKHLPWIDVGLKYLGTKEIPGPRHSKIVLGFSLAIGLGWMVTDDSQHPWCASYVNAVLKEAGLPFLKSARARNSLDYGNKLSKPAVGCLVIFERGAGGHVGFVMGQDKSGNLMVLGGNQSNKVSIAPFSRKRVLGYRFPVVGNRPDYKLPVIDSNGAALSQNEI